MGIMMHALEVLTSDDTTNEQDVTSQRALQTQSMKQLEAVREIISKGQLSRENSLNEIR